MAVTPPTPPSPAWVGIVVVLVTTLFPVVKWVTSVLSKRKSRPTEAELTLVTVPKIYDKLTNLCGTLDCVRVAVMSTSNGGGVPSPGKNQYTSMLYEVIDLEKVDALRPQFQDMTMDEDMVRIFSKALLEGEWAGTTEEMPVGLLKKIAVSEGVTETRVTPLGSNKTSCYFLWIQWITPQGEVTRLSSDEVSIQTALVTPKLTGLLNL